MSLVLLKNGSREEKSLVETTMAYLEKLLERENVAFYELLCLCNDRNYQIYMKKSIEILKDLNLVKNNVVSDSVRNIMYSALTFFDIKGGGYYTKLTSPITK